MTVDKTVDSLGTTSPHATSIVFHTEGEPFMAGDIPQNGPLFVFIGPEGGWSPGEMEMFHRKGMLIRRLGSQVLRAETAVIAALSKATLL